MKKTRSRKSRDTVPLKSFLGGLGSKPNPKSGLKFKMPAKNQFFITIFSACYFLKVHLHYFSKIKIQKESLNSRIQGFSYYFCMIIQGSGSRGGSGSGSIPLTSGSESGFGRPKNTWIRIRNTATRSNLFVLGSVFRVQISIEPLFSNSCRHLVLRMVLLW